MIKMTNLKFVYTIIYYFRNKKKRYLAPLKEKEATLGGMFNLMMGDMS